jgi:uncharacterized phage protein (TIGR01671 family)
MKNREIKFRAWDNGQMVYSKRMPDFSFWKWSGYSTDTVLMQWTGLKDKNGKEIYEGDILISHYIYNVPDNMQYSTDQKRKSEVVFENHGFNLYHNKREIIGLNKLHVVSHEVIGNIYQNPELLKEDNEK